MHAQMICRFCTGPWLAGNEGCTCMLTIEILGITIVILQRGIRGNTTSQMIYHRGGEPERPMHCWFNVMAHKPWITVGFVTICCFMSMVSKTSCSHFSVEEASTHAWTKWSYELNLRCLRVLIMHGHYLKRTQLLCTICTICEQPVLVCHGQQLPCMRLTWVVFVPGFLHTNTALASSRAIGMELDSAGSTVSTCTGTTSFKTCTNLKCTCTFIYPI